MKSLIGAIHISYPLCHVSTVKAQLRLYYSRSVVS